MAYKYRRLVLTCKAPWRSLRQLDDSLRVAVDVFEVIAEIFEVIAEIFEVVVDGCRWFQVVLGRSMF